MIFIKIKTFKTNFYFIKKISFGIVLIESKALYNACVHTNCHLQYAINQEMFKNILIPTRYPMAHTCNNKHHSKVFPNEW